MNGGGGIGGGSGGSGGGDAVAAAAAAAAAADAFDPAFDINAFLSADPTKLTAPIPTVKDKYELVPAFLQVRLVLYSKRAREEERRERRAMKNKSIDCIRTGFGG